MLRPLAAMQRLRASIALQAGDRQPTAKDRRLIVDGKTEEQENVKELI
jgi:hypothetical protein